MTHVIIQPFSTFWNIAVLVTVFSIAILIYGCLKIKKDTVFSLSKKLGYFILIQILFTNLYLLFISHSWVLQNNLPLSLCRISIIFSALALITKKYRFVSRYFWWNHVNFNSRSFIWYIFICYF